jgi:hypothetical protein
MGCTPQWRIKQLASADVHIAIPRIGSIGAGYVHNGHLPGSVSTRFGENVVRVSFDTQQMRFVSSHRIRARQPPRLEERRIFATVTAAGEQPTLIHFDIADRDRDLFTLAASIFPVDNLSITFSAGDGRDSSSHQLRPGQRQAQDLGVGFDFVPTDHVNLSLFQPGHIRFLQYSPDRTPPDPRSPTRHATGPTPPPTRRTTSSARFAS